jgi:glyoxylase-like metal-dependent hydrolase (beta-lactamase superfamily II)
MKLSAHCYALTGLYFLPPWAVNSGFIVGAEKTLVVDSGGCDLSAQTILGYAAAQKPENPLWLINTEKHFDHIGGNSLFRRRGVDIFGHYLIDRSQAEFDHMLAEADEPAAGRSAADARREAALPFEGTRIVNPNVPISAETTLPLGTIEAEVILTPGHTDTNLSVFIPADGVIFCGDCVVGGYAPNTGEADIIRWKESLEKIRARSPEVLVPGHGNVIRGTEKIRSEIGRILDYLDEEE